MHDRFLGMTPPMGWNSWNTFTWNISDALIRETADKMVETGLKDAGYEYVVIDDCWSLKQRDSQGRLAADPEKFPHGMKALSDYVHSKGLKFGMYSCNGTHTCAGYPGSFEHEFQDAETFASWGVDYLKYDNCYRPQHIGGEILYKRMSLALRNCGRDIMFSACNWGHEDVHSWIQGSGAQLFRSTGDIQDNWSSIKSLALSQLSKLPYSGPFCHNDIDMLVVGMHGGSNNEYIGNLGGCTDEEYRTHFSLWAMMDSPLMIGCDVRSMSEATRETLTNPDVIAINQDIECRGPYCIPHGSGPETGIMLVKPMSDGSLAIGLFNFSDRRMEMSVPFWDLGLSAAAGNALQFFDCWTHEDEGVFTERYVTQVDPHGCAVYRARLVKR